MEIFFSILLGLTALISLGLIAAGVVGLVKKTTYALDMKRSTAHKVEGPEARRTSIYYLVVGLIWTGYVVYRTLTSM